MLWIVAGFCLPCLVRGATAHEWLISQQHPATGLVDSYEGDNSNVAYTYDQACAAIAFMAVGDRTRAERILDRLVAIQFWEGSWSDAYDYTNGQPLGTWRAVGNSLWVVMAMNYYTIRTGDTRYVASAKKCADWVLTFQEMNPAHVRYGSISGGLTDTGARHVWTSTEHNQDAYSAFKYLGQILNDTSYVTRANLVYNWLVQRMWEPTTGHFYVGLTDLNGTINYGEYLDVQPWGIASLGAAGPSGQDFTRGMSWAYNKMRLVRAYNGQNIEGFDYDGTVAGVWFEGTEQMVLAYELLGQSSTAAYFHGQVGRAQSASGGVICAVGDGPVAWPTHFPFHSVAATSWYIYGSQTPRVNPFQPVPGAPDITPPGISGVGASSITENSAVISWNTDEPADSQVEYGLSGSYGSSTPIDPARVTSHSVALTGLMPGTLYHYHVVCRDAAGNMTASADFTFTTLAAGGGDTTPPAISSVQSLGVTSSAAEITWTTDEGSDSQVEYGTSTAYGSLTTSSAMVTTHGIGLTGLAPQTTYHYRVRSRDAAGNTAVSGDFTFMTAAPSGGSRDYAPTAAAITAGYGTPSVAALLADDNNFMSVNSQQMGSLFITDWQASTAIAETPASVTRLTIAYSGHYTANQMQGIYLWNFASSVWARVDYRMIGTAEQQIAVVIDAPVAYISSAGEIRARVYTERPDNVASYNDLIRFTVDFSSAPPPPPPPPPPPSPSLKTYPATGVTLIQGSGLTNSGNINGDDGAYMTVGATVVNSQRKTDWYARTQISESRAQVAAFTVTYNGRYSAPRNQGVYLYNFASGVWARIDYRQVGTTDTTITYRTTDLTSYLSSSGQIRMRVEGQGNGTFACFADFVQFSVELR